MTQDSLLYSTDSLIELSDSLSYCDTTFTPDTIAVIDTIAILPKIPRGVEGKLHPSFSQNQNWTFIVLFVLFGIMIFSLARSSGLLLETIKSFFQVKERTSLFSKTTLKDFRFRIFLVLFSVGVFSLYAHVVNNPIGNDFQLTQFSYFFGITLLFFILKNFVFEIVGYVFLNFSELKVAKEIYFNIVSFLGLILFPLVVTRIYIEYNCIDTIDLLFVFSLVLSYLLLLIKIIQIFLHKILALFYILLYLCTLEILPLSVLFKVYKLLI